jgi:hypothetical protein
MIARGLNLRKDRRNRSKRVVPGLLNAHHFNVIYSNVTYDDSEKDVVNFKVLRNVTSCSSFDIETFLGKEPQFIRLMLLGKKYVELHNHSSIYYYHVSWGILVPREKQRKSDS